MLETLLPTIIDAVLLGICLLLGRRARDQQEEIDRLRRNDEWLEDRIGTVVDLYARQKEDQDRTEKLFFDGISNIMNYDLSQARKAVSHEDED